MIAHVQPADNQAQHVHGQRLAHGHAALLQFFAPRALEKIFAANSVHQKSARNTTTGRAYQRLRHLLTSVVGQIDVGQQMHMQLRLINVVAHAIDHFLRIPAQPKFVARQRNAMACQLGHAGNLMLRRLQLKVPGAGIVMHVVCRHIHFRNYFCVATNSKRAEASFTNQEIRDQSADGHGEHNHHPRHGDLRTISFSQQHNRGHENLQREFSNNKDWIDYCQLQAGLSTINFYD